MPRSIDKKRRVCLVTAGARGFGQAISRWLAELGHDVAVSVALENFVHT